MSARVTVEATIYGAATAWLYVAAKQMHMLEGMQRLPMALGTMVLLLVASTYATIHARVYLPLTTIKWTRSESDCGMVVGVMLVPLVLASRLVVEYAHNKICQVIGLGLTTLLRVFIKLPWSFKSAPIDFVIGSALFLSLPESFGVELWHVLLTLIMYNIVLTFGIIALPRSFTFGEAIIMSEGCTYIIVDVLLYTLHELNLVETRFIPHHDATTIVSQLVLVCGLLLCAITTPLFQRYGSSSPRKLQPSLPFLPSLIFLGLVGLVGIIFLLWSSFLLGVPVWVWLLNKIMEPMATKVIIFWLFMLGVAVPLCPIISKLLTLRQIVSRKLYHFLAVAMFLPASYWDIDLLRLSYAIAVGVFMIVECVRALAVPPFGLPISKFVSAYLDRRDEGRVILTHTYLLLGCALPVWLSPNFGSLLTVNAGVLALGIGDAMGAIVGSSYGRHKVCGNKSLEGSAAVFVSMVLFGLKSVQSYHELGMNENSSQIISPAVIAFFGSAWLTTTLEAVTCQIDNLVLPLFYFTLCGITEAYANF
ncbi:dolichol kinase [Thraustotheca clavata]|uniref:dolichol kinase n=1 Tax=Thraustotheca clavata TaxID=74557 RepID=A0A1W0A6T5_9STRA|nr:dolichol kinase [Thraustotheca clavata]